MTRVFTGGALTTTNAYDQSGPATLTDVQGNLTTTVYDNAGGTTHVISGGALNTTGTSGFTYDQQAGVTQVDGTVTTYEYDATGGNTLVTSGGKINTTFQYAQSGSSTTTFVNAGGVISAGSAYVQNGGKTTVDGTLTGTGKVQGSVSNTGGMLMPGNAPGTGAFTITGNYSQGAAGSFITDIASAAGFDALDVGGMASLDGTLEINLPHSFGFLTNGEQFVILDAAGGLSGTFGTVNGLNFGIGDSWLVGYGTNTVTLTAQIPTTPPAPEPGEILVIGIGLLALGWAVPRRNRLFL